jgi:hypothetical protein
MWRHLGIARAFTVHQMFTEAAEEYEAALKYAPDSTDLLRRTIAAHQRTGNTPREKELSAHLAKITKRFSRGRRWNVLMYPRLLSLTDHGKTCTVSLYTHTPGA